MSKPLHVLRRQRKKRSTAEMSSELDMTSMIDVVFLLLIFFMCATKFKAPEGQLRSWLPRDRGTSGGPPQMNPGCRLTLVMDGKRVICWADDSVINLASAMGDYGTDDNAQAQYDFEREYGISGPHLGLIEQHIQRRKNSYRGVSQKGLPVIIDFAKEVPSRYVVDIVNICTRLEIEDIAFAKPEIPIE